MIKWLWALAASAVMPITVFAQTDTIDLTLLHWRGECLALRGGFSNFSGSFSSLSISSRNLLHLGETLTLSAEYGVRRHRMEFIFDKPSLFSAPIHTGFTIYGQRFHYNQSRESSVFAFQRDIPVFNVFAAGDRLDYVSYSYGGMVFAEYPLRGRSSHFRVAYSYDVSDFKTLTASASDYFSDNRFLGGLGPNSLNGIRTGKLIPSFTRSTVDDPIQPTHGTALSISAAVAGIGGDVNTIEPSVEARYFRPGFKDGHVIGMRVLGRLISGYGDKSAPPFDRYYVGGEEDIRGFDNWSISPILYVPGITSVNVLNNDGSQRQQRTVDPATGQVSLANVTQSIPIYRIVSAGGDSNVVVNLEYRIPLKKPLTLVLFTDAGVNRIAFRNQLKLPADLIGLLNSEFPSAGYDDRTRLQAGSQRIRMSNGIELQVLVPKIKAPLRFYMAYNALAYRGMVQAPLATDRGSFANTATYLSALGIVNAPLPFRERRVMFRFSIGHTFGGRI